MHRGKHWGGHKGGRARRGFVRTALLVELLDGPGHGYELGKRIEARTDGRWSPGPGSIYPNLEHLAEGGFVSVSEQDGKKIYELTAKGTEAAEEARDRFDAPFGDDRDSAMRKNGMALFETLRTVGRQATDDQATAIGELLDQTRRQVLRILAD